MKQPMNNQPSDPMFYDVNRGNVERWRERRHWSAAETTRWTSMRGTIKQTVRGSHVDIYVSLCNFAERAFPWLVCVAGVCLLFVGMQIAMAFFSGRVHQILESMKLAN
jgi:hypothetical protein